MLQFHWYWALKMVLILCSLCAFILPGRTEENGVAATLTTNSAFVLYLQNPPWIKKIAFRKSQLLVGGKIIRHVDISRWFIESYEAAIQPGGVYYDRHFHHLPINNSTPVGPVRRDVGGISRSIPGQLTGEEILPTKSVI